MKAITLTPQQLAELRHHLQGINEILGQSITIASAPIAQTTATRPRRRTTQRQTSATFTYRWLATESQRITQLYQYLLRAKWIALDTNPDDFFSLFAGGDSNARIKWTGSSLQLAHLFRVMTGCHYLTVPKAMGKWACVHSHFVDKNGRPLPKLNRLHVPKKSQKAIEQLAELLNPTT